ncbi:MAG: hypothetical protein IPP46_00965 [Bacteroidetes bacterium]|nr:hypothetical protein [Bacteroidota bacterium]
MLHPYGMGDGGGVPVLPVLHPYGMGDGGCTGVTSVTSLRDEMEGGWEMEGMCRRHSI